MTRANPAPCKVCGRSVLWARNGNRVMPLDPVPHPDGTILVRAGRPPRAIILGREKADKERASGRVPLFRCHLENCRPVRADAAHAR